MKITAALCILACVVASVQSAAPANCKDQVAYATNWEYTGALNNDNCIRYLTCPVSSEHMVPSPRKCKRSYFDPTKGVCSKTYKCPKTTEEKAAAKAKAAKIAAAQTKYDTAAATTKAAKEKVDGLTKTSTEADAKAKTDAAALVTANAAVTAKEAACTAEIAALKTTQTAAVATDKASKAAATAAKTPIADATTAYNTAKAASDTAATELTAAKA